jgi:hypothetical protein
MHAYTMTTAALIAVVLDCIRRGDLRGAAAALAAAERAAGKAAPAEAAWAARKPGRDLPSTGRKGGDA